MAAGTILSRAGQASFSSAAGLSPLQSQVDGMVTHFVDESTNGRALASIAAGSLAYRTVRLGVMGLGEGRIAASFLRPLSVGLGLSGEVAAFEGTGRSLASLTGDRSNPNLWRWNGTGGWGQGLASSFVTFGMLKGAGHLSRETNLIFQHSFSSTAMVAGHQTASLFGWMPRPTGSLAEQLLHAEVTNLQLGAGGALVHSFAPGLHSLERGLDLSLRTRESLFQNEERTSSWVLQPALSSIRDTRLFRPAREVRGPLILQMSSTGGKDGKGDPLSPGPSLDSIPTRQAGDDSAGPLTVPKPAPRLERDDAATVMDLPPESEMAPPGPQTALQRPLSTGDSDDFQGRVPQTIPAKSPQIVEEAQEPDVPLAVTRHSPLAQVSRIPPSDTGLEAGVILENRYQVMDYLGSGGFGHVIKVKDLTLGRSAVIKIPRAERNTEEALGRFNNEIRISANLDPRRVVTVYDLIRLSDGRFVPVMEYVPGNDLFDVMHQIPLDKQLEIFIKICEGVDSAHRRGFVHRDLKPANIRITNDGDVRIMDWGLSKGFTEVNKETREEVSPDLLKNLEQGLTVAGTPYGSPGYIAPEVFEKQYQGNPRTIDIFAMGVILYEMITGQSPFTFGKGTAAQKFYSTHPDFFLMPPDFREAIPEEFPSVFYEKIEEIVKRAIDLDPEKRFQSASELREALLMVRAQTDFDEILKMRQERSLLEVKMTEAWNGYSVNRQVTPELEEQMEGSLNDLLEKKGEIDQAIESLVLQLTRLTNTDPAPKARKMIAELNWMQLIDGGDLMTKRRRQARMNSIREFDTPTEEDRGMTSMKDSLTGHLKVEVNARDLKTGQSPYGSLHVKVIPIEENRPGYFREALPLLEGNLEEVQDQLKLARGYYVIEVSAPGYAFMRLPLHVTWPQVRDGILTKQPLRLNLTLIPQKEVPRDFFVVHEGEGEVGLNIDRFEDPSLVISFPQRKIRFERFAVTNPVTVDQFRIFLEDNLKQINSLIQSGRFEEALQKVEEVRGLIPRDQPRVPGRLFEKGDSTEEWLATAFDGVRYHWRINNTGEGRDRQFSLINPSEHPSLRNDPILGNQPVSGISYLAAEAYAQWRSSRDHRDYKIISADQKEIITRNSFPWTYPWGYRFRRTFLASRLVHRDLERDTHAHPIGTHPLGPDLYKDFSIYGGRDRQGRLVRLVDLLGNVREWTSTRAEEKALFMSGGSVRTPSGTYFLPASRTYYPQDVVEEYNGGFRLVLDLNNPSNTSPEESR